MASGRGFRFIHASDFHLERPPRGLTEVPDHLRDLLLDAAYEAASHVFHFAVEQEVDFVVLAGDLLDADATGPRGPLFLIDQFSRLAEHGIEVFWAGSSLDAPERWPDGFTLPDNVRRFPTGGTGEFLFHQGGFPVARLLGQSRFSSRTVTTTVEDKVADAESNGSIPVRNLIASDYDRDDGGLFTIGVLHAKESEMKPLLQSPVEYWALGGSHGFRPALGPRRTMYYPGSPQGREPSATATHHCLMVHVEGGGVVEARPMATDALRWCDGHITLSEDATADDMDEYLEAACEQQVLEFSAGGSQITHLVRWIVDGPPHLTGRLRHSKRSAAILKSLREKYGSGLPPLWSVSLQPDDQSPLPEEMTAQENFLGDFLRTVARYAAGEQERKLELESFLDPEMPDGLQRLVRLTGGANRQRVLNQAAHLGSAMLSGLEVDE